MDCEIRSVTSGDILSAPNATELFAEYSAECSIPEIGTISPQRGLYAAMEGSGLMHTFGAYRGGALVGFASVLVYPLPHYGKKVATVESIFLRKIDRLGGIGRALMQEIEQYARKAGCIVVLYSAPTYSKFALLLALNKSCRHTNSIFCKSLK